MTAKDYLNHVTEDVHSTCRQEGPDVLRSWHVARDKEDIADKCDADFASEESRVVSEAKKEFTGDIHGAFPKFITVIAAQDRGYAPKNIRRL